MSLADALILAHAPAWNVIHADAWQILGPGALAGLTFTGEVQTEAPMVLETELGTDAREKSTLYVDRPAPALQRGMQLRCNDRVWTVVGECDDNPANARVKYDIQLKSPVDS